RQISPECKPLQFIHQLHVFIEALGNPLRPIQRWQLGVGASLHALKPPFDFPNRIDILTDLSPIARAKPPFEPVQIVENRIKNTLVLPGYRGAAFGGSTITE